MLVVRKQKQLISRKFETKLNNEDFKRKVEGKSDEEKSKNNSLGSKKAFS